MKKFRSPLNPPKGGLKFPLLCILFFLVLFSHTYASPLSLKECLKIAQEKNPRIISYQEKVKAAEAKVEQAKSYLIPRLGLDLSYGPTYQQLLANETTMITSYNFNLQQTIFTGGKVLIGLDMSQIGIETAKADLKKAKLDLNYDVTSTFYSILKAKRGVMLLDESIDTLNKHLRQVNFFYKSGLLTRADVLRVETQVANLRLTRVQAKNGLKIANAALNSLLHRNLNSPLDISNGSFLKDENVSKQKLLITAFANRPDWQSFLLGKKILENQIGFARSDYWPNIALTASTGKTYSHYTQSKRNIEIDSWRVLLAGNWTFFNGFETMNKVKEAEANLESIKAQEETIRDGIELEVTTAYLGYEGTMEQVKEAKVAVDLARNSLRLASYYFKTQSGTSLAVLDAQTALYQAETSSWNAIYDREVARAKIDKTIGALPSISTN